MIYENDIYFYSDNDKDEKHNDNDTEDDYLLYYDNDMFTMILLNIIVLLSSWWLSIWFSSFWLSLSTIIGYWFHYFYGFDDVIVACCLFLRVSCLKVAPYDSLSRNKRPVYPPVRYFRYPLAN